MTQDLQLGVIQCLSAVGCLWIGSLCNLGPIMKRPELLPILELTPTPRRNDQMDR